MPPWSVPKGCSHPHRQHQAQGPNRTAQEQWALKLLVPGAQGSTQQPPRRAFRGAVGSSLRARPGPAA